MTDPTSRDQPRHQTLRAFKAGGGDPAQHPRAAELAEVAGRDRWLARDRHRDQSSRRIDEGSAGPIDVWTIELLDDDTLADWFLDGLPDAMVRVEEQRTLEAWEVKHRPWAIEVAVMRKGFRCAISGRTDGVIAIRLTPRLDEDRDPIVLHPDEVAGATARGLQAIEEGLDLVTSTAAGPALRRRLLEARLAEEHPTHRPRTAAVLDREVDGPAD